MAAAASVAAMEEEEVWTEAIACARRLHSTASPVFDEADRDAEDCAHVYEMMYRAMSHAGGIHLVRARARAIELYSSASGTWYLALGDPAEARTVEGVGRIPTLLIVKNMDVRHHATRCAVAAADTLYGTYASMGLRGGLRARAPSQDWLELAEGLGIESTAGWGGSAPPPGIARCYGMCTVPRARDWARAPWAPPLPDYQLMVEEAGALRYSLEALVRGCDDAPVRMRAPSEYLGSAILCDVLGLLVGDALCALAELDCSKHHARVDGNIRPSTILIDVVDSVRGAADALPHARGLAARAVLADFAPLCAPDGECTSRAAGTLYPFVAPEIVRRTARVTRAADMWSIGMVVLDAALALCSAGHALDAVARALVLALDDDDALPCNARFLVESAWSALDLCARRCIFTNEAAGELRATLEDAGTLHPLMCEVILYIIQHTLVLAPAARATPEDLLTHAPYAVRTWLGAEGSGWVRAQSPGGLHPQPREVLMDDGGDGAPGVPEDRAAFAIAPPRETDEERAAHAAGAPYERWHARTLVAELARWRAYAITHDTEAGVLWQWARALPEARRAALRARDTYWRMLLP